MQAHPHCPQSVNVDVSHNCRRCADIWILCYNYIIGGFFLTSLSRPVHLLCKHNPFSFSFLSSSSLRVAKHACAVQFFHWLHSAATVTVAASVAATAAEPTAVVVSAAAVEQEDKEAAIVLSLGTNIAAPATTTTTNANANTTTAIASTNAGAVSANHNH